MCEEDLAIAPQLQEMMAERANITQVMYLDSGHEPFFTCPDNLVQTIVDLT